MLVSTLSAHVDDDALKMNAAMRSGFAADAVAKNSAEDGEKASADPRRNAPESTSEAGDDDAPKDAHVGGVNPVRENKKTAPAELRRPGAPTASVCKSGESATADPNRSPTAPSGAVTEPAGVQDTPDPLEDETKTKTDSTPGAPTYSSYPSDEMATDEPKRSVASPPARVTFATMAAREGDQLCAYVDSATQEAGEEEPVVDEFVPRGHDVQEVAPTAAENVPRGQIKHVALDDAPGAELDVPTGHAEHVAIDVAPTNEEKVPGAQDAQTDAPGDDEYVPARQSIELLEPPTQ
jgi:hypothetical protein